MTDYPRTLRVALLVLVLSALLLPLSAQRYHRKHPHDFRNFNMGFQVGLTINSYNLKQLVNVVDLGEFEEPILLENIEMQNGPGINISMINNYRLDDQIELRVVPGISLEQRNFTYNFSPDSAISRRIESAFLNVPIMLRISTKYYRRYRLYTLVGVQYGINFQSNEKVQNDPNLLKIENQDFGLTFGFGMTLYGDRLKLAPEIRYSMGLRNVYVPDFTSHAAAIQQLFSQVISLNINFE